MAPSATASATPAATPACAAPHVSSAWRPGSIAALFTNRVGGCTASPGCTMATNGTCPARGVASAVAHAVPAGPSRGPSTTLTWAASAPSPTKDSPISSSLMPASTPVCRRAPRASAGAALRSRLSLSRSATARTGRALPRPANEPMTPGHGGPPAPLPVRGRGERRSRQTALAPWRPGKAMSVWDVTGRASLSGDWGGPTGPDHGSHERSPFASSHDPAGSLPSLTASSYVFPRAIGTRPRIAGEGWARRLARRRASTPCCR